ncbi:MAG: hypothetical protein VKJ24_21155 [Synechococcales bacterium]|nr:hypothetical protein [Synechococcales bacterium]
MLLIFDSCNNATTKSKTGASPAQQQPAPGSPSVFYAVDAEIVQIIIADEFKREARTLKKRYRTIEADLQPLIDQL